MICKRLPFGKLRTATVGQASAPRRLAFSLKTLFLLVALVASYLAGVLSQRALLFRAWQEAAEARQAADFERTRAEVAEISQLLGVLCDGSGRGVDLNAYVHDIGWPISVGGARGASKLIFDDKGLPASPWEINRPSNGVAPPAKHR